MSDADEAAVAAATLARFAERVREHDRPPAGSPADRIRRLFARAALVRRWPAVRALFADRPPTSDASLTATARELAKQCQADQKGGLWGWPREAKELLSKAADRLTQLAGRLDAVHTPTGTLGQLDRVFVRWTAADPPTAQLVHLDVLLAGQSDACRDLIPDLADHPLGHVFDHFDAKLKPADGWTPEARTTAGAVCVIADRLTQRTSDPQVWAVVRRWAEEWFRSGGGNGAVLLEGTPPPAGAIVEPFPLQDPGRRVVLVLVPPDGGKGESGGVAVGSDGTGFDWPAAVSRVAEVPFGTVVEVLRSDPADPRVAVSDGPVSPPFAAFHELFAATADRPEWWAGGRWKRARQLCLSPDPGGVAALAGHWLDESSPTAAEVELVCRWAEACGLEVVRVDGPDTPGVRVRPAFGAAPAGTLLGTNRAGFSHDGVVLREAVAEVSLGPPPAGFAELQRAADRLPAGSELRALVGGLRAAAEGNYLREAVLQLYTDFWGEAGQSARAADSDATADVGERLSSLLADAYGLQPFHPVNVHDLPSGWITVAAGSRVMTGVVTRVLRPGLQDDHGHLRIPAVVEVE